ncbi:MAG: flagellin FliC [Deltaproteobacteria bacterium]|nr:MAG: flagellin FliC [Deltaproteobacteria bacterium]
MPLSIQTNVASINAQRNMQTTMMSMESSLSRLSSGYRITKAGDDAAGLGVSENLRAQIRSLQQAQRNAYDGVNVVQIAEGSYNEISNILVRMRELAMQSASDGIGDTERGYLQTEFTALHSEIDRIVDTTEFNGQKLIDGSLSGSSNALTFQVGIRNTANDRISLSINDSGTSALGLSAVYVSTKSGAQTALSAIDSAIQTVSTRRAQLGALGNRLNSTIANLGVAYENLSSANSRIRDVDVAVETSSLTRSQILLQAGVAVLAQANAVPQVALSLLG